MIVVTGAGGYLGAALVSYLRASGHTVQPWGHRTPVEDGAPCWSLTDETVPDLSGITAVVHAAWDLRASRWADIRRGNIQGAERLIRAARDAGVPRFLFVSSMAAFAGCRSMYGRAKWTIEQQLDHPGDVNLRPGAIWGDPLGGILGSVDRLARKSPVVPVIGSGKQRLFTAHLDDVCAAVGHLLDAAPDTPPQVLELFADEDTPFAEVVRRLGARVGRHPKLLPLPGSLLRLGLQCAEAIRLPLGLRSDSITSLLHPNHSPSPPDPGTLGPTPRLFDP